jgi:vitamin B12/bleomycin/antimicrobial peptide transport system ATP-binding/permease protein
MPQGNISDRDRLNRFWSSASEFWRGKSAIAGWSLTIGLFAIGVAQLAVQYRLNFWNRDFFNALGLRDGDDLRAQALIFVPLALLSVGLKVAAVWGRMTTQRKWRESLTRNILHHWLSRERYRRLPSVTGEYQNAEYRISIDARTATDAPVDLAFGLITALLSALVFIDVLWEVGGSFTLVLGRVAITVPGYLVIGVGIYSAAFTGVMMAIGRRLPAVIQVENQAEAEFLAAANQIRESAGRPVVTSGERDNYRLAWGAMRELLDRWRQLCWQLMGTTLVTQADLLFAPVVAWVLCAPKYLAGTMTLGELTQASAAFVIVQVGFNWLVDNYQRLSDWRSAVNRVATLLMALDEVALLERDETP